MQISLPGHTMRCESGPASLHRGHMQPLRQGLGWVPTRCVCACVHACVCMWLGDGAGGREGTCFSGSCGMLMCDGAPLTLHLKPIN